MPRIGRVMFNGHSEAVPCTVREFSPSGAVLVMDGWLGLPTGFNLHVDPDGVRAECRVLRRKGNYMEVEFLSVVEDDRSRDFPARPGAQVAGS